MIRKVSQSVSAGTTPIWVVTTSVSKSLAKSRMRLDRSMSSGFFSGLAKPWPKSPHSAEMVSPRDLHMSRNSLRFCGDRLSGENAPLVAYTCSPVAPTAAALSSAVVQIGAEGIENHADGKRIHNAALLYCFKY